MPDRENAESEDQPTPPPPKAKATKRAPRKSRSDNEEVPRDPIALNRELLIELRRLNRTLERFNRTRRHVALSLTGGITRGFGAAMGATFIFAVVFYFATRLFTVPVVGEYVKNVVEFVRKNSPAGALMPTVGTPTPSPSPSPASTPPSDQATPNR